MQRARREDVDTLGNVGLVDDFKLNDVYLVNFKSLEGYDRWINVYKTV